jgi:hypothetical protein
MEHVNTCENPLERRGSPLYLCYSTLGQNLALIVPISYFLTAAHSQVRFDVSNESVIPGVVGKAEHWHLPLWQNNFRSVRLFLFYHCGWRVSLEILSIGIKTSSSTRWCWSTAWMHILISPPHWPHVFCVDCSCPPSNLVMGSKVPSLDWTRYLLWWIWPFH